MSALQGHTYSPQMHFLVLSSPCLISVPWVIENESIPLLVAFANINHHNDNYGYYVLGHVFANRYCIRVNSELTYTALSLQMRKLSS